MPFADEQFAHAVEVSDYNEHWAEEGNDLVALLTALFPAGCSIDHIGSTAVPGLPSKDCIDVMVRVPAIDEIDLSGPIGVGFRERPEEWNRTEELHGERFVKRVLAAPRGARSANIHIRERGSATSRYALLFRDFLRADAESRRTWGRFKSRLTEAVTDLNSYGQIKAAAQPLLMAQAEHWAQEAGWAP